jgi:hypothetical protein
MKTNVKTLQKILTLSAGCSLVAMSHADNTITFTGTVSDTTCTATIDNGVSSIDMGTVSVADLKANTYSAAKSFSFTLTDCPTDAESLTKARITFGGEADTLIAIILKTRLQCLQLKMLLLLFLTTQGLFRRTILKVQMLIFLLVEPPFRLPSKWLNLVLRPD